MPEADVAPCNSRYDGQVAVFGNQFQKKLGNLKYFLVSRRLINVLSRYMSTSHTNMISVEVSVVYH